MNGKRKERDADLRARGLYFTDACIKCTRDCEVNEGHNEPPAFTIASCTKWRRMMERAEKERERKLRRTMRNGNKCREAL